MSDCFSNIFRKFIPYSYHTNSNEKRDQHYMATFVWTAGAALVLETFIIRSHFSGFAHMSEAERRLFAGTALMTMVALSGMLAALIHFSTNYCCSDSKNRSDYSVQVNSQSPDDTEIELSETTGLMGQDLEGASVIRVQNCHPVHTIYPATPMKTALWIPLIGLTIYGLANLIRPGLFDEFAGNIPVTNGFWTNCSGPTDHDICVSILGCVMGLASIFCISPIIAGGVATLFHHVGAKATEPCENLRQRSEHSFQQ